jgi:hypothetical protein
VADDVDLARAGRDEDTVDEGRELLGAGLHPRHAARLVEGRINAVESAVGQREDAVAVVGEQRRDRLEVDGLVGEQPVDEYDRLGVLGARLAAEIIGSGRR